MAVCEKYKAKEVGKILIETEMLEKYTVNILVWKCFDIDWKRCDIHKMYFL